MNPIDLKYISLISGELNQFKVTTTSPYRANFRCPICGDSTKSKTKKRGWFLGSKKNDNVIAYCHNCGYNEIFERFLSDVNPSIHKDYKNEKRLEWIKKKTLEEQFSEKPKQQSQKEKKPNPSKLLGIKKVSELSLKHPARKYVEKRMIPDNFHYKLYYAPKYKKFVNRHVPGKFDNLDNDEPRLVIPYYNEDGEICAISGRSFKKTTERGLKYLSIKFDEDFSLIYGMERVDFTKKYYVVEGPIDSMFIPNCVAMSSTSVDIRKFKHIENAVFVLDNEPRNKEVVKRYEYLINHNVSIFIANTETKFDQKLDINDMIMAGKTPSEIMNLIDSNTYSGLRAKLEFQKWRKI